MNGQQTPIELFDLVKEPARVSEVDHTQIPALLTQLSAVQASMAARLVAASQDAAKELTEQSLLTIEDAAQRLGVSKDWLYRRTRRLPFVVRVGGRIRFSPSGIDRYIRNRMGH
jgi:excisionase family DNA binding protein